MKSSHVQIDLNRYKNNILDMKKLLSHKTDIMAVIKADAYGHGAVPIAKAAACVGVKFLGVANIEEARDLRSGGIDLPIFLLSEPVGHCFEEIINLNIVQTVYSEDFVFRLNEYAVSQGKIVDVHVKVDTGMGRIGLSIDESLNFVKRLTLLPGINFCGLFTHFANADNLSDRYTWAQNEIFLKIINNVKDIVSSPFMVHAANSDATINFPYTHHDMVRIGIASYKGVMSLKSYVGFIKNVSSGICVSYGSEYCTSRPSRIATVMIGYGDGYPRSLGNVGNVRIGDKIFKIIGRVCMDMMMVDLDNDFSVEVGNEVTLLGNEDNSAISMSYICEKTSKISYEIMCGISKRVPRIYFS